MAIERVADALLVEDEPAPGRPESVSIVRAHGVAAPMTDVIIVVIALIATAFAVALAVLLTERCRYCGPAIGGFWPRARA